MVVDDVSKRCTIPSVAQKGRSVSEIASGFFSYAFMGPSSARDLRISSRPPGTSLTSDGIMRVIAKLGHRSGVGSPRTTQQLSSRD